MTIRSSYLYSKAIRDGYLAHRQVICQCGREADSEYISAFEPKYFTAQPDQPHDAWVCGWCSPRPPVARTYQGGGQ